MDQGSLEALLENNMAGCSRSSPESTISENLGQKELTPGLLDCGRASSCDQAPHIKSIAIHLETITRAFIAGINFRLFDIANVDALSYIDPDFSASPNPPFAGPPVDWKGYIEYVKTASTTFPEYQLNITDLSTVIHETPKTAEVYMNFEVSGSPPGVIRQSVGVLHYRFSEGKWRVYTYDGIFGMEGTESATDAARKACTRGKDGS